jgi:hypothetical protein
LLGDLFWFDHFIMSINVNDLGHQPQVILSELAEMEVDPACMRVELFLPM